MTAFDHSNKCDIHDRERWQIIQSLLRDHVMVQVIDVCEATGASPASIRRDFAKLAEQGIARRAHGGLESIRQPANINGDATALATRSFIASQGRHIVAKCANAKAAVDLCEDSKAYRRQWSAAIKLRQN